MNKTAIKNFSIWARIKLREEMVTRTVSKEKVCGVRYIDDKKRLSRHARYLLV